MNKQSKKVVVLKKEKIQTPEDKFLSSEDSSRNLEQSEKQIDSDLEELKQQHILDIQIVEKEVS
jgi:hypothetical protein